MRPALLDPLFVPLTSLEGVGAKVAGLIGRIVPADLTARDARLAISLFDAARHGDRPAQPAGHRQRPRRRDRHART